MAETTDTMTVTAADMGALPVQKSRLQKSKLTLGDLGTPSLVKDASKRNAQGLYSVGRIFGRADAFCERTSPKDGAVFEGLVGTFVFMPSDHDREELESGIFFLPDAFHNIIAERLRVAKKNDASASLDFALDAFTVEAKNPAGYSWVMKPVMPFAGRHPLDDVMGKVAALEAPRKPAAVADQRKR